MGKYWVKKANKTKQHKHQEAKWKLHNWKKKDYFQACICYVPGTEASARVSSEVPEQGNWCTLVLQILLTVVSTPHVWAPTGSQHINHSHGHSNPGKPVTSDSNVHRHVWYYIILHPKYISRTLISPKSTFKNIWKCFHSITEKGWNQIGLYTAIIFEIHFKKYPTKKSVVPAQNWLYAMFFFFFSLLLCVMCSIYYRPKIYQPF